MSKKDKKALHTAYLQCIKNMLFQYTVDFNDEREKLDWDTIEEFIDKWVAEHFLKDPLEEWNPYPQSDER